MAAGLQHGPDPVSGSTIIPREVYLKTGYPTARRTLARIQGPTATHFASGRCLPILGDVAQTGTAVVGVSAEEDLAQLKAGCGGGFILSDNHGEIPWQVPEEVLLAMSEAWHKWGRYPLDWIEPVEK